MIIAQISDSHITQVGGTADHQYATATHLQRAVAYLTRLPAPPDVVLVTGDCVDRGSVAEYERFRDLLRPLTMPVYVIPGNHDDRVHLRDVFGTQGAKPMAGFVQYVVDAGPSGSSHWIPISQGIMRGISAPSGSASWRGACRRPPHVLPSFSCITPHSSWVCRSSIRGD
jgi:hypothetical protein